MIKIEIKQIKDNLYKLIWLSESLSLSYSHLSVYVFILKYIYRSHIFIKLLRKTQKVSLALANCYLFIRFIDISVTITHYLQKESVQRAFFKQRSKAKNNICDAKHLSARFSIKAQFDILLSANQQVATTTHNEDRNNKTLGSTARFVRFIWRLSTLHLTVCFSFLMNEGMRHGWTHSGWSCARNTHNGWFPQIIA